MNERVVRGVAIVAASYLLSVVGGSSPWESWTPMRGFRVPPPLWVGGDTILHYEDTLSMTQYVLDELALRYVGEYTDRPQDVHAMPAGSGWVCGFGLESVRARIPAKERTEVALRTRARSLVERRLRTGR